MGSVEGFTGARSRVLLRRFALCVVVSCAIAALVAGAGRSAGTRATTSCSAIYMPYGCNLYFTVKQVSFDPAWWNNAPMIGGRWAAIYGGGFIYGGDGCSGFTEIRNVTSGPNRGAFWYQDADGSKSYADTNPGTDTVTLGIGVSGCNGWVYHVYLNGKLNGTVTIPVRWGDYHKTQTCHPGQALGIFSGSSLNLLEQAQCKDDPIDAANGSFQTAVTDATVNAPGMPFKFTRYYSSDDNRWTSIGMGWDSDFDSYLSGVGTSIVTANMGSGPAIPFTKNADGSFSGPNWSNATLSLTGTTYTLTGADQLKWRFVASGSYGLLTAIVDRSGNQMLVSEATVGRPDTVTTTNGKLIQFTYATSQHGTALSKITLPDGRTVLYGHDATLNLTQVTDAAGRITKYTSNSYYQVTTETDPRGHTVLTNAYGDYGRISSQTDGRNKTTTYTWADDANCFTTDTNCLAGGTAVATDPRGHSWTDQYTSDGVLANSTDPLGNETSYTYDARSHPSTLTDPTNKQWQFQYDGKGNLTQTTFPDLVTTALSYTALNDPSVATNARGYTTTYGYDTSGNPTSVQRQNGQPVSYTYNSRGQVLTATNERGKTTTFGYNTDGYLTSATSPLGNQTTYGYDGSGRMTTIVDPRGNVAGCGCASQYTTTIAYDNDDEITSVTDSLGHVWSYSYDADGNLATKTDPNNHTWTYDYDNDNNLTKITNPDLSYTTYGYDDVGNLTSVVDANGHTTSYTYDDANRLISMTDGLLRQWTFFYDADSRLQSISTPSGGTITYTYDSLGHRTGISYSDTTQGATFSFDNNGNRSSMTDGAGTVNYTYDTLDRLTAVTRGTAAYGYTYDDAGNILTRTYPDGTVTTYAYDDDGRLHTATTGTKTTAYAYDPAGNLVQTTLPNGVIETANYDHAGRMTERNDGFRDFTYGYDNNGNVTSKTVAGTETDYTYDSQNRLLTATTGTNATTYTWDNVGNRTSTTDASGTTDYTYDAANELTSTTGPSGTTNYTYNPDGDETGAGSWTFTVDLAGRVTAANNGAASTSFSYDGDGNRLTQTTGSTTTNLSWDVNAPVAQLASETDGSGTLLRRYIYGLDRISMTTPTTTGYYSADMLGTVTEISSSTGTSLGEFTSNPFGDNQTSTGVDPSVSGNPFGFAGAYQDPVTGLYDMHARQYDPAAGRFLSPDPLGTADTSQYAYVGDNPLGYTDPTGMHQRAVGSPNPCATAPGVKNNCRKFNASGFPPEEECQDFEDNGRLWPPGSDEGSAEFVCQCHQSFPGETDVVCVWLPTENMPPPPIPRKRKQSP
jgi:RHS repeat-associated protein